MRFWRCYKVMKFLWLIDKDNDIWKFPEDYSYWTIYYKKDNYIIPYSCKTTKDNFIYYKMIFSFKEISEADAFFEML